MDLIRTHRFTFEADSDAVARARHAVTGFAREHGLAGERLADVALAVSEACTNVVVHAYRDRPSPGAISVGMAVREACLLIHVGDDGTGIRPRTDSPGLGMGLPIIASVTDSFVVEPGADGGTELCMRFDLPPLAVL